MNYDTIIAEVIEAGEGVVRIFFNEDYYANRGNINTLFERETIRGISACQPRRLPELANSKCKCIKSHRYLCV